MSAKTIRKRLLSVLDLNVHISTVGRARKEILGIAYFFIINFEFLLKRRFLFKVITIGVQNANLKKNILNMKSVYATFLL